MNKKIPMRTCILTKEVLPKKELIRIVKNKEGNVFVDESGKLNGRGVYLKKDKDVFKIARDKNILSKALEIDVPTNIYDELDNLIK